jgi:hypothetical protein
MSTSDKKEKVLDTRLELIKQRHKELILNAREEMWDGLLEDDETFDSLDEGDDLGYYGDYAGAEMEV